MEEIAPQKRLALGWRLVIFMVGIAGIQILLSIVAVVLAGIYLGVTGVEDPEAIGAQLQSPEFLLNLQIGVALPLLGLALGWVIFCRRRLDQRSVLTLGLGQPSWGWPRTVLWGTLAGILPIATCIAILWGFDGLSASGVTTSAQTWLLFPTLLFMAFYEEVVFRGYVLRNFLERGWPVRGILLSSLAFALMHSLNPDVWSSPIAPLNLFGAGIALSLAYLVSNDLWFPTVLHFAWNMFQGVVFELPMSGLQTDGIIDVDLTGQLPGYLTGEGFGLEGSLLVTLAEVVLCVILYALWKRQHLKLPSSP